jgi:hypothetical protein
LIGFLRQGQDEKVPHAESSAALAQLIKDVG